MRPVSELRRRNALRMLALYVVAAWLIMRVVEVLMSLVGLQFWTGKVTLVVLAIGFPITLAFSWFYELKPEGMKLNQDIGAAGSAYQLAETCADRGETDNALERLERSYDNDENGGLIPLLDPLFANLHDDPRLDILLDKRGLPH
jgi:hypothetical protein